MKVLITGGGGFLGFYIAKLLIKENFQVVSFSRSKYEKLTQLGVEQISGDLQNKNQIMTALTGVDAVIHTASKVGMNGSYNDFYHTNFIGTKNLVDSMKEMGVKRLIFTSTPSVVFGKDDIVNGDESLPYPNHFLTYYAQTKKMAEEYVLSNCDEHFFALSLRPHLIFGPGDQNLIPRVVEASKKGKLKIVGDGENKVDIIYVENAALAHLLALKKVGPSLSKKAYFIGQGPVNLWNFTNQVLIHYGLPPIKKKISLPLAYAIGAIIEFGLKAFRLHHIHPPMSRFIALQLGKSHYFSHHNSINDLGNYQITSIEEAISKL